MRVGLIHSLKGSLPDATGICRDLEAEYQDQREVEAIQEAIRANGHDTVLLACDLDLASALQQSRIDLAFNIAEGWGGRGRESIAPALLEMLGIPYTGSDALTLGLSLDKALTKTIAQTQGVATPPFFKAAGVEDIRAEDLAFPLFVKPNSEGSSMGIGDASLAENEEQLRGAVSQILERYRGAALVEQFVPGREFAVGIVGNGADLQVLPTLEIEFPEGVKYYRFDRKVEHQRRLRCPAPISGDLAAEMDKMALTVYQALECRDFARVDFRIDAEGRPLFLEINPLPGLHPESSLFPQQAYPAGLTYEQLIGRIMAAAMARYGLPTTERC